MAIIFFTLTGDKEPTINLQTHLSKKIHKKITHRIYEVKISNKLRNVINNCKRELDMFLKESIVYVTLILIFTDKRDEARKF